MNVNLAQSLVRELGVDVSEIPKRTVDAGIATPATGKVANDVQVALLDREIFERIRQQPPERRAMLTEAVLTAVYGEARTKTILGDLAARHTLEQLSRTELPHAYQPVAELDRGEINLLWRLLAKTAGGVSRAAEGLGDLALRLARDLMPLDPAFRGLELGTGNKGSVSAQEAFGPKPGASPSSMVSDLLHTHDPRGERALIDALKKYDEKALLALAGGNLHNPTPEAAVLTRVIFEKRGASPELARDLVRLERDYHLSIFLRREGSHIEAGINDDPRCKDVLAENLGLCAQAVQLLRLGAAAAAERARGAYPDRPLLRLG